MVPVTQLPSHLPDLSLENIFKRVPLGDLLHSVRVVCTNWHRLVPSELSRRRELVLVRDYNHDVETVREKENPFRSDLIAHVRREDGSPWVRLRSLDQIRFNALLLPGRMLTEAFTTPLMDTVPSITRLTVVQRQITSRSIIPALEQLVRLLNQYRDRLVSFKLIIAYTRSATEVNRAQLVTNGTALFNAINQVQSLRHLTLNVHFPGVNFFRTLLPRLSVLSRLDTFVSNCVQDTWLMDSIRQHATEHVRIDLERYLSMQEMNALDPQMNTKITLVDVNNHLSGDSYDNLRQFGVRFFSISRLTLTNILMPMTMLARCLSPLTQLVHLKVSTLYIPQDEQPQPDYVPVPSVGLLSLRFITQSHLDTERLHLAQIFPNLQVLSLWQEVASCHLCEFDVDQMVEPYLYADEIVDPYVDAEVMRARVEHCIRLSRQPFRRCATLHSVKHEGWSMDLEGLFPDSLITRDQL